MAAKPGGRGAWIQTFTGRAFYPLSPRAEEVDIRDIAHALSQICRFTGHSRKFYSVAEHCVRVSRLLPADLALWGLLHDAAEAYTSDVSRPVKRHLPEVVRIEDGILEVIMAKHALPWPMPRQVKDADDAMLLAEARDLMEKPPMPWSIPGTASTTKPVGWSPRVAEARYLALYAKLCPGRKL